MSCLYGVWGPGLTCCVFGRPFDNLSYRCPVRFDLWTASFYLFIYMWFDNIYWYIITYTSSIETVLTLGDVEITFYIFFLFDQIQWLGIDSGLTWDWLGLVFIKLPHFGLPHSDELPICVAWQWQVQDIDRHGMNSQRDVPYHALIGKLRGYFSEFVG